MHVRGTAPRYCCCRTDAGHDSHLFAERGAPLLRVRTVAVPASPTPVAAKEVIVIVSGTNTWRELMEYTSRGEAPAQCYITRMLHPTRQLWTEKDPSTDIGVERHVKWPSCTS